MWNECDSWPKLLCQRYWRRPRYISGQSRRVGPPLLAKIYLHDAWEEIERGLSFFFSLPPYHVHKSTSRDGDAAWRCQDHVANQRRSLCGTKKITVTRLTTHGDTTALTLRIRVAHTHTHTQKHRSAVDQRYLRLHTSSPLARGSYSANSKVLRLRLRHSSPPYVRAPAYI